MAKVVRNYSTEENREFWRVVEAAAEKVPAWPDWKRARINVATERSGRDEGTNAEVIADRDGER